jgi:hypothetical protein
VLQLRFARIEWTVSGEIVTVTAIAPPLDVLEYVSADPRVRTVWTRGVDVGEWPVGHEVGNVTETLIVSVRCDAPEWLRILRGALERARYWAEGFRRDMHTVIQVRDPARHGVNEWFEAILFGGQVHFADSGGRTLRVVLERAPYWYGAERRLQVMNSGTGWDWADQATIYNHDDEMPGHNNWVMVEAPAGDVPTPARLLLTNTYEHARLRHVMIGWHDRPAMLVLEGEDASGATAQPGVEYSNAACGIGSAFRWTVPNTGLVDYVGMFRVLALGNLTGATWQLAVGYELTRLQLLREVSGRNGWTDLGAVMLPPGGYAHPTRYDMRVWLNGSADGYLDMLQFVPLAQYRRVRFAGYNAQPGTCIEDDGWRGELVYQFGEQRLPILSAWGDPIRLWPETMLPQALPGPTPPNAQMLVLALENDGGRAEALRTAAVEVFARPRYAMLP